MSVLRWSLLVTLFAVTAVLGSWVVRVPIGQGVDGEPRQPVGEITRGGSVRQTLTARSDGLTGLDITFGTFARTNSSHLDVTVAPEAAPGSPVLAMRIAASDLADNQPYPLRFPPRDGSQGERLVLTVTSPDAVPGNAVTLWSAPDVYAEGSLTIDGRPERRDLSLTVHYRPRTIDYLLASPSHLLKMRDLADAQKLVAVYVAALAGMAATLGATLWLVRRDAEEEGAPSSLLASMALAAGLLGLVALWIASGRV